MYLFIIRTSPVIDNIQKLGIEVFKILEKEELVDKELDITFSLALRGLALVMKPDRKDDFMDNRVHYLSYYNHEAKKAINNLKQQGYELSRILRQEQSTKTFSMTICRS